jgi:hypothetical protein
MAPRVSRGAISRDARVVHGTPDPDQRRVGRTESPLA